MKTLFTLAFAALFTFAASAQTLVKFYTTMGDFVVTMSDSLTPITSGNFIDLADSGYYDGVIFHRVIDNFMIQGGDPTGTGTGGPGYSIPDEFDSTGTLSNIQGSISMANSGPNTGGSQFFINLVNNTYLDYDQSPFGSAHPVFGQVSQNFNIVQDIGNVSVNNQNRPNTDVVMDSLRLISPADTVTSDTTINDTTVNDSSVSIRTVAIEQTKLKVFPNPVGLASVITVDAPKSGTAQFAIIDQTGRQVLSFQKTLRKGMNRFEDVGLRSDQLSPGIYFLSVDGENIAARLRFVVSD